MPQIGPREDRIESTRNSRLGPRDDKVLSSGGRRSVIGRTKVRYREDKGPLSGRPNRKYHKVIFICHEYKLTKNTIPSNKLIIRIQARDSPSFHSLRQKSRLDIHMTTSKAGRHKHFWLCRKIFTYTMNKTRPLTTARRQVSKKI